MPTYEFRCPDGHDFEKFYRTISSAESQAACPVCGKVSERRISPAGFAFKGSGFYLTDYGKNAHRKGGESKSDSKSDSKDTASTSSGESKSESSTASSSASDAKPAAPATPKPSSNE